MAVLTYLKSRKERIRIKKEQLDCSDLTGRFVYCVWVLRQIVNLLVFFFLSLLFMVLTAVWSAPLRFGNISCFSHDRNKQTNKRTNEWMNEIHHFPNYRSNIEFSQIPAGSPSLFLSSCSLFNHPPKRTARLWNSPLMSSLMEPNDEKIRGNFTKNQIICHVNCDESRWWLRSRRVAAAAAAGEAAASSSSL